MYRGKNEFLFFFKKMDSTIDGYLIIAQLGNTVYKAEKDDELVAIKIFSKDFNCGFQHELDFYMAVKDKPWDKDLPILPLLDHGDHYLVFPLCEQNLKEFDRDNELSIQTVISITIRIVEALKFVHSCGFAHCDIRAENIMIDKNLAYLIDFDLSIRFDKSKQTFQCLCDRDWEDDLQALQCVWEKIYDELNILDTETDYDVIIDKLKDSSYV
jgi:serine/threonine protein kinase